METHNGKTKIFVLSLLSAVTVAALIFVSTNKQQFNNVSFSKLNNNNFDNKGKYDYMKKGTSFQPSDKKKHVPSVLRWNN